MVPELEKPRVTEIQVRIDCNGCVQKIKKALHGINGIYDVTMDVPQQKLRIIGWADPERIVKAIRKTRKMATICSHAEQTDPAAAQSADLKPESSAPPQEAAETPPLHAPPTEHGPPAEPPKDQPPSAPLPEKPVPPQEVPQPEASRDAVNDQQPPDIKPQPKDVGEIRTMYHHPQNYGYRYRYHNYEYSDRDERWYRYPGSHRFRNEPPPPPPPQPQQPPSVHVTHSYNTYEPSSYVTEYENIRSLPRFSHCRRMDWNQDYYGEDYCISSSSSTNGNITSIFDDENPNACRIM